jgi:hypothetical protein
MVKFYASVCYTIYIFIFYYVRDEADTVQDVMLKPAAAGLDVICQGIRLVSPDDRVALERGRLVYEALYAQFASEPTQE